jgi:L-ascorbate metabolism protein UlaG (beta-lactamase superfamily)
LITTRSAGLLIVVALAACSTTSFDPPPAPTGPAVELHYLGNGGWIFQRGTDRIATAPFVSNPNGLTLLFPRAPNAERIERVIPAMSDVREILVGHSHYDHAMDLPLIATTKARHARLYGPPSLVNILAAVPALAGRLQAIAEADTASTDRPGRWFASENGAIRFLALRSTHAPHLAGIKLIPHGRVTEPQTKLPCCPYWWTEGETLAYVVDFLDPTRQHVEFRIYYQDAASRPGTGVLPALDEAHRAPVDVAILCVAAFDQVKDNPEHILANVQPRRVVGGHWEDFFFRSYDRRPARAAPGTSLADFKRRVQAVWPGKIHLPEPQDTLRIPIEPRR